MAFNLNRQRDIGFVDWLEGRVNQSFVQVKNQGFAASNVLLGWSEKESLVFFIGDRSGYRAKI